MLDRSPDSHEENHSPSKGHGYPEGNKPGLLDIQPDQGEPPVEGVNDKNQNGCGQVLAVQKIGQDRNDPELEDSKTAREQPGQQQVQVEADQLPQ